MRMFGAAMGTRARVQSRAETAALKVRRTLTDALLRESTLLAQQQQKIQELEAELKLSVVQRIWRWLRGKVHALV